MSGSDARPRVIKRQGESKKDSAYQAIGRAVLEREHMDTSLSQRAFRPCWFRFGSRPAFNVMLLTLGVLAGAPALAADQFIYNYDALGRLQSVTYQNGGSVAYTYDAAGNRTQVTNTAGSASNGPPTPQQRRKLAAIQAILSILLGH